MRNVAGRRTDDCLPLKVCCDGVLEGNRLLNDVTKNKKKESRVKTVNGKVIPLTMLIIRLPIKIASVSGQ